jgi:hypothetical protein
MEMERFSHESYGQIQFNRVTGTANFYGSELTQQHYISMEVHNSEIVRDITQDRYFNLNQILRIRLSSGQFSELITSMNNGSGVPCTIERIGNKKVDKLPIQESRKEFVHRKFQDRMKMFADSIREKQNNAKELVKKKVLSKQDMHDLEMHLEWLTTEVERNIPFFAECFQETMDEMVFEAKTEVENAIQHKINVLGLNALHEENKLISDSKNVKESY